MMSKGNKFSAKFIAEAAIIAGIYVVLSLLLQPITYEQIQCRVAEALIMTVFFTPAGAWGVCIGCFITNLFSPSWLDLVFGTLATVIAVLLTLPIVKSIKKKCGDVLDYKHSLLIPIPTVLVNAIIIPFVLYFGFGFKTFDWGSSSFDAISIVFLFTALSIAAGEIVACYVFGPVIIKVMKMIENRMGKM